MTTIKYRDLISWSIEEAPEGSGHMEIQRIKRLQLPGDNWYTKDEANDEHREWGCGDESFALIDDGRSEGPCWFPILVIDEDDPTPDD